jgi:hypothetical protein
LHNLDEKMFYGKADSNKAFPPGNFCAEIILHGPLDTGSYKIVIIDSHKRVGEVIFHVK